MVEIAFAGIPRLPERKLPSAASAVLFRAKVGAFRAIRLFQDIIHPLPRLRPVSATAYPFLAAQSVTPLWSDIRPEEAAMQLGKIQNLRRADGTLDGLAIPAGAVFSFWQAVGRTSRRRGYVAGRMLQEGCLVGALGGGLCQLSNGLFDVAQQAGTEIVERHRHSRIVPGSAAVTGRDATVAWNYVDFRFRAPRALRLEVRLTGRELIVRLWATNPAPVRAPSTAEEARRAARVSPKASPSAGSGPTGNKKASRVRPQARIVELPRPIAITCATCSESSCHRREQPHVAAGRTAFILDESTPEFRGLVAARRRPADVLAIPLDGDRWGKPNYGWATAGYSRVVTATGAAIRRGLLSRRHRGAPGPRVAERLRGAERLAAHLARALTPDVAEIVVSQSLLPYLWQAGHLGGRRVSILATQLPIGELHARLDAAARRHPNDTSLTDYRAPDRLVEAEAAAFAEAAEIVTPHTEIAALFGDRATLLAWQTPMPQRRTTAAGAERRIAFPGPAIGRKGVVAVRDVARALGLEVVLVGNDLSPAGFWDGVRLSRASWESDWLRQVAAVVQPAVIEDKPRALLRALAAGLPVIASPACGLPPQPGVTLVPAEEPMVLATALLAILPPQ